MENRRLIVLFATGFSFVFSIFYYFLFTMTMSDGSVEKRSLYMNQVGLYEKTDSVNKMKDALKEAGLNGYPLKQGELTAVVCSVSTDEKETKKDEAKLKELKYSYIAKKVTVEDPEVVKLIDSRQYDKALERIGK